EDDGRAPLRVAATQSSSCSRDAQRSAVEVPLLSLKFSSDGRLLHVVRGVESYVHEGYEPEPGAYSTREVRQWVRELIATFALERFDSADELRLEVASALERAITGTRLPLTPMEAPHPLFSFGQILYIAEPQRPNGRSLSELPSVIART